MPPDVQKLLKELKQGLIRLYGKRLKGLYLYGSYARGDFEEGSDLDVLVVLDDFQRAPAELDRTRTYSVIYHLFMKSQSV
jgi:uncharacterized protein